MEERKTQFVYIISKKASMDCHTSNWIIDKCFRSRIHAVHYLEQQKGFNNIDVKWSNQELYNSNMYHCTEILNGWKLDKMKLYTKKIDVKGKRIQKILNTLSAYDQELMEDYYRNKISRIPVDIDEII